jgi:hypothetical protein
VTNAAPTTSINHALEALNRNRHTNGQESLQPFKQETLLARILVVFEELYAQFRSNGWNEYLGDLYHKYWLHRYIVKLFSLQLAYHVQISAIIWSYARKLNWGVSSDASVLISLLSISLLISSRSLRVLNFECVVIKSSRSIPSMVPHVHVLSV